MSKIKLTKGELKKQRDSLKQFRHYLPTLQLKKQQLQIKILEARRTIEGKLAVIQGKEKFLSSWVGLLADPVLSAEEGSQKTGWMDLKPWIMPTKLETQSVNIAGANIPVLKDVQFADVEYDFYTTPFWTDRAIVELRDIMKVFAEISILRKQIAILEHELRITTQRVNLFEKIKIPECLDNIRKIRIYLGDQQANAVGISKVAKKKVDVRSLVEVGA